MDRRQRKPRGERPDREEIPSGILPRVQHGLVALVVEPDPQRRQKLEFALVSRGYSVLATESRAAASDLLDGSPADVLVAEEPGKGYRVVWLSDERSADIIIEPGVEGWRRFDESSRERMRLARMTD